MMSDDTDPSAATATELCNQLNRAPEDLCNRLHEEGSGSCNRLHNYDARIAYYLGAARAPATHRAYAADIAAFLLRGGTIPTTPQVVAAYLASSEDLAVSTLRRRLAAIADAHQTGGYPDPTKHPLVRKVFRGIRRVRGAEVFAPDPLDVSMLSGIIRAIPDDLVGKRDRALLLVGFFCALRRSELVSLCVTDLHTSADGWTVNIRRSKTDQNAAGQHVSLPSFSGSLCPAAALTSWLAVADITDGPLFRIVDKLGKLTPRALAPQSIGAILRQRATSAGLPTTHLSAHSLRSGFATSAVRAGMSLPLIQAVTRHTTLDGLAPYVRTSGPPTNLQMAGLIKPDVKS
jgi:integrase